MKTYEYDGKEYARIEGVGMVTLAKPHERMTINQAINAKSYQSGLPTKYFRERNGRAVPQYMRCFISLCKIRIVDYMQAPNTSGYSHPNCF